MPRKKMRISTNPRTLEQCQRQLRALEMKLEITPERNIDGSHNHPYFSLKGRVKKLKKEIALFNHAKYI